MIINWDFQFIYPFWEWSIIYLCFIIRFAFIRALPLCLPYFLSFQFWTEVRSNHWALRLNWIHLIITKLLAETTHSTAAQQNWRCLAAALAGFAELGLRYSRTEPRSFWFWLVWPHQRPCLCSCWAESSARCLLLIWCDQVWLGCVCAQSVCLTNGALFCSANSCRLQFNFGFGQYYSAILRVSGENRSNGDRLRSSQEFQMLEFWWRIGPWYEVASRRLAFGIRTWIFCRWSCSSSSRSIW